MKTLLSIVALLLAPMAHAHGGGEHVMGTVKAVDEHTLTVETKDKKDVTVVLEATTKFERDGKPATAKDVTAGDRIVVHATNRDGGGELAAAVVKLSTVKKDGP